MPIPSELRVLPVTVEITVFRIVTLADQSDPAMLRCFESNFERGKPQRPRSAELAYRMVWHAISVFDNLVSARDTANNWPRLGSYIAELRLKPDAGFSVTRWGSPGHLSAWGEPARFVEAIADIVPVNEVD